MRLEPLEGRQLLASITVNTTADDTTPDATLSLRQAIEVSDGTLAVSSLSTQEQAQVTGAVGASNTIGFNIPTTDPGYDAATGVWTIAVQSALPAIVTNAAIIDGYSQPGASENTFATGDNAKLAIAIDGGGPSQGTSDGLTIDQPGSQVLGLDIEDFGGNGVVIAGGGGIQVAGCFIGTDPTGEVAAPNGTGVVIESSSNTIGGATVGDRDVISGNAAPDEGDGLYLPESSENPLGIAPTGNLTENCYIGVDAAGAKAIANGQAGVADFGTGNTYGGTAPGVGDVISGNASGGLKSNGSITIEGSFVGTDATGDVGLGNGLGGFGIINEGAAGAAIATTVSFDVVSGNSGIGISLYPGSQSLSTFMVTGNMIGTNAAGTAAIGNGAAGLGLGAVENTTVTDNVISANNLGIQILGFGPDFTHNVFQGNRIGTDETGAVALGNTNMGVTLSAGIGDMFGGTGAGQGNIIAFNGTDAIDISGGEQDQITQNSMFGNLGVGIDLTLGANASQVVPVLTYTSGTGMLSGSLASAPNATYTVEIFSTPIASGPGHQQGKTFIEDATVNTDATGRGTFTVALPLGIYTATATDAIGNTSEFSPPAGSPALPATTTTVSSSSNPSTAGEAVTFTSIVAAPGTPGTPTGSVTFTIDGQSEPPVTLALVGGVDEATFTTSTLAVGGHTVSAAYGGDATFSLSTGSLPTQTVDASSLLSTTTSVSPSSDPSTAGESVTFTAVVAAPGVQGTPTGTVTFTIDGQVGAPVPLALVGGVDEARFTTSALVVGTHTVSAAYGGDASFNPSGGSLPTQTVDSAPLATTSTVLSAVANPSVLGQQVVFTATVTSADGSPISGTVAFMEGTTWLGSEVVGVGGTATLEDSSLPVGSNAITAIYGGDSGHASDASNPLTQVVESPTNPPAQVVESPTKKAPTVVSIHRFGYHMQPTTIVLTFSAALDAASAMDASNYRIVTQGGRGRGGELVGHSNAIRKAVYDPSTLSVTLVPKGRLDIHNRYRLTVNGATQTGVREASGPLLDGNGSGDPGSNDVAEITWRTLEGPAPGYPNTLAKYTSKRAEHQGGPSAIGFDATATSGGLETVVRGNGRLHPSSG